jgi:hypothetical protein
VSPFGAALVPDYNSGNEVLAPAGIRRDDSRRMMIHVE